MSLAGSAVTNALGEIVRGLRLPVEEPPISAEERVEGALGRLRACAEYQRCEWCRELLVDLTASDD